MREAEALAPTSPSPINRLKRENYRRTKHDPYFSKWQVLVGACDWEDYSLGKEGATKYRVHNLPTSSGPGIYELGISASQASSGKLDPDDIVVVYLGQADNVRTRLQSYGRSGAHLGTQCLAGHCNELEMDCEHKGPGLFEVIFRRGFSIVFRWAPMKDKRNAERTEAQLLDTFDYAWNKGTNGSRRPDDILLKLEEVSSRTTRFPNISKRLLYFGQGRVGIKIKETRPLPSDKVTNLVDENNTGFFSRIFKFGRTQPRRISDKFGSNEDLNDICGFILNNGSPCKTPTVAGRKRCEEHKGRKICRSIYISLAEGTPNMDPSSSQIGQDLLIGRTCGLNLGDGTFCNSPAVAGRKRCEGHKGMKVNGYSNYKTKAQEKTNPLDVEVSGTCGATLEIDLNDICGFILNNGSPCKTPPVAGRKRCEKHKGRKICGSIYISLGEGNLNMDSSSSQIGQDHLIGRTCGVNLGDGTFCNSPAIAGRKRCEEHKGMKINGYSNCKPKAQEKPNPLDVEISGTCGATLENGSFCKRKPKRGNKRCWQHKGKKGGSRLFGTDGSASKFDTLQCGVDLEVGSRGVREPDLGCKRCEQGGNESCSINHLDCRFSLGAPIFI